MFVYRGEEILTWTVAEKDIGEGEERGWSGCLLLIIICKIYRSLIIQVKGLRVMFYFM